MLTIEEVICDQQKRYPIMMCQDYVKLVYQHCMGPGHLVRDPESARERLTLERGEQETGVRFESIGNGLIRCYLSGEDGNMTNDEVSRAFYKTACVFKPDPEKMGKYLGILCRMAEEGRLNVSGEEMGAFVNAYSNAGYPLVSHSERYHEAYHPSYRIMLEEVLK